MARRGMGVGYVRAPCQEGVVGDDILVGWSETNEGGLRTLFDRSLEPMERCGRLHFGAMDHTEMPFCVGHKAHVAGCIKGMRGGEAYRQ